MLTEGGGRPILRKNMSISSCFQPARGMFRGSCIIGAVAIASVAGGCTIGPNVHEPRVPVPARFAAATQPSTQPATEPYVDLRQWWESFHDPVLDGLIQRAVASNLDVRLA